MQPAVAEKFRCIAVVQFPHYLALVGAAATGIPGRPASVRKSARRLLRRYAHIEAIPPDGAEWRADVLGTAALPAVLERSTRSRHAFRTLATLRTDAPLFASREFAVAGTDACLRSSRSDEAPEPLRDITGNNQLLINGCEEVRARARRVLSPRTNSNSLAASLDEWQLGRVLLSLSINRSLLPVATSVSTDCLTAQPKRPVYFYHRFGLGICAESEQSHHEISPCPMSSRSAQLRSSGNCCSSYSLS